MANADLAEFRVFGATSIGWDAATPANEVVDEYGTPLHEEGFGEPDPRVPARRDPDDPEVAVLRGHLRANNGLRGLEICTPPSASAASSSRRRVSGPTARASCIR